MGPALTVKLGAYIGGIAWGAAILIAVPLSDSHPLIALIIINLGFIAVGFGIGPMFPAFILAAGATPGVAPAVAMLVWVLLVLQVTSLGQRLLV